MTSAYQRTQQNWTCSIAWAGVRGPLKNNRQLKTTKKKLAKTTHLPTKNSLFKNTSMLCWYVCRG